MCATFGDNTMHVLMITVRADYGGGPEHICQLMKQLKPQVQLSIAAPNDQPYLARFAAIAGRERTILIPHRKFTLAALYRVWRYCKKNGA